MAKLADASMGKLFDIHQEVGRVAVNELVGSLKNFPEDTLASAIDLVVRISNSKCCSSLANTGRENSLPQKVHVEHCRHLSSFTPMSTC